MSVDLHSVVYMNESTIEAKIPVVGIIIVFPVRR